MSNLCEPKAGACWAVDLIDRWCWLARHRAALETQRQAEIAAQQTERELQALQTALSHSSPRHQHQPLRHAHEPPHENEPPRRFRTGSGSFAETHAASRRPDSIVAPLHMPQGPVSSGSEVRQTLLGSLLFGLRRPHLSNLPSAGRVRCHIASWPGAADARCQAAS